MSVNAPPPSKGTVKVKSHGDYLYYFVVFSEKPDPEKTKYFQAFLLVGGTYALNSHDQLKEALSHKINDDLNFDGFNDFRVGGMRVDYAGLESDSFFEGKTVLNYFSPFTTSQPTQSAEYIERFTQCFANAVERWAASNNMTVEYAPGFGPYAMIKNMQKKNQSQNPEADDPGLWPEYIF